VRQTELGTAQIAVLEALHIARCKGEAGSGDAGDRLSGTKCAVQNKSEDGVIYYRNEDGFHE
jgi:hypothetical protein